MSNRGYIKPTLWWKEDPTFLAKVLEAVEHGQTPTEYARQNYPDIKASTLNKFLNDVPENRQLYENAKNRDLLRREWLYIREEARLEAEETGESLSDVYKRWGVDCELSDYRVGEKGDVRWKSTKIKHSNKSPFLGQQENLAAASC